MISDEFQQPSSASGRIIDVEVKMLAVHPTRNIHGSLFWRGSGRALVGPEPTRAAQRHLATPVMCPVADNARAAELPALLPSLFKSGLDTWLATVETRGAVRGTFPRSHVLEGQGSSGVVGGTKERTNSSSRLACAMIFLDSPLVEQLLLYHYSLAMVQRSWFSIHLKDEVIPFKKILPVLFYFFLIYTYIICRIKLYDSIIMH